MSPRAGASKRAARCAAAAGCVRAPTSLAVARWTRAVPSASAAIFSSKARSGVAQGLLGRGRVECGGHLEAGWGIKADEAIVAHGCIRAGESLCTDGEIRAGCGYGVFAGLSVRRDAWECSARVCAQAKPGQLMSGWWVEPSAPGSAPRG